MMSGTRLLRTLALVFLSASSSDACSCQPNDDYCSYFENAALVLHATVVSSTRQAPTDVNDDIMYTVKTEDMYKSEPNVKYGSEISFTTAGDGARCGIYLEHHKEYLIYLRRNGGQLTGSLCAGTEIWSDGLEKQLENCLARCEPACDEFQECRVFKGYKELEYYCADLCDPSPCEDHETCTLHPRKCRAPCPPLAVCTPTEDPCSDCKEFQECRVHREGYEDEEYYCADTCDPNPCADGHMCELEDVTCVREPCPPVATCRPKEDPCYGACGKFQECLVYLEGARDQEYYCQDVCDPNPCEHGKTCELEEVLCKRRGPCPSVATCKSSTDDPCDGACGEYQDCIQFRRSGNWHCSDRCYDGACGRGKVCKASKKRWCRGKGKGCPRKLKCKRKRKRKHYN